MLPASHSGLIGLLRETEPVKFNDMNGRRTDRDQPAEPEGDVQRIDFGAIDQLVQPLCAIRTDHG